jgi:CHAT domain-containing protein
MPRLFERFHRIKNAQGRTHEGTGIGLALMQELVKLHGGSVRASDLSFRDSVGAIYFELADLLLRRHVTSRDPNQNLQDLIDARETVELIKAAEIEDYFQDDCVAALQAKTKGVDQLAPQTAALYPIILPERMELLLSLPSGMRLTTVPINKSDITNLVRRFRETLEKRTTREVAVYPPSICRVPSAELAIGTKIEYIELPRLTSC